MTMTESSTSIDKALTQHDVNARSFISRLGVIDPESTNNDASRIEIMIPLVPETPIHRRCHRRQNAQFFGCFDVDKDKDTATPTNVTSEYFPKTNNPDFNAESIVSSGPKTSLRQNRQNAHVQDFSQETTTITRANIHCSGDGMHVNKDTSMAVLDNNSSSDLMQWRFSKRYLTNSPVSPHNKDRHTCSLGSSGSNEDGNSEDSWAQGVTQLSQLYANGRYQKQRGEIITEDYFFRNDEGTWNHLEWHSRQ
jgi:hypothetical protein